MLKINKNEYLTEEQILERARNRIKKELFKLGLSDDERRKIKKKKKAKKSSRKKLRQLYSTCDSDSDHTDSSRDDGTSSRKKTKAQKTKLHGLDLNEKHFQIKRSRDRESVSPFVDDKSSRYSRAGTSLETGPTPSRRLAPVLESRHEVSRFRQDRSLSRHSGSRSQGSSRSRHDRSRSRHDRSRSRDKRSQSSHGRSISRYGYSSATSPGMERHLHERRWIRRYQPIVYKPNISETFKPLPKKRRSTEMDLHRESNTTYIERENEKRIAVEELEAKKKEAVKDILLDIEKPLNKFTIENNASDADRKRALHEMFQKINRRMEDLTVTDAITVNNLITQYRCKYSVVEDEIKLTELFNDAITTRREETGIVSGSFDDVLFNDLDSLLHGLDLALILSSCIIFLCLK